MSSEQDAHFKRNRAQRRHDRRLRRVLRAVDGLPPDRRRHYLALLLILSQDWVGLCARMDLALKGGSLDESGDVARALAKTQYELRRRADEMFCNIEQHMREPELLKQPGPDG